MSRIHLVGQKHHESVHRDKHELVGVDDRLAHPPTSALDRSAESYGSRSPPRLPLTAHARSKSDAAVLSSVRGGPPIGAVAAVAGVRVDIAEHDRLPSPARLMSAPSRRAQRRCRPKGSVRGPITWLA